MWHTIIQDTQFTLRLKDAIYFFEGTALVLCHKMMDNQAGDNSVERRIRVRKGRGKRFIPLNIQTAGFLARNLQHLRVAIHTRDVSIWIRSFEHQGQRPCATSKIKHVRASLDVCPRDKLAFECFFAHDPFEDWVIQWRKPAKTQGRDITFLAHDYLALNLGRNPRNRFALPITVTDEKAIAAPAISGLSRIPKKGNSTPIATGMP